MNADFKYSRLYLLQPILINACLIGFVIGLISILKKTDVDNYLVTFIIGFCIFIFCFLRGIVLFMKRINGPLKYELRELTISAKYRNGRAITIPWEDIDSIVVHNEAKAIEVIEISSKKSTEQIVCDSYMSKYPLFKKTISEKYKGRIKERDLGFWEIMR